MNFQLTGLAAPLNWLVPNKRTEHGNANEMT